MGNLFGSDFMDFMVYKDIKEKREGFSKRDGFMSGEDAYFDAYNSPLMEHRNPFESESAIEKERGW